MVGSSSFSGQAFMRFASAAGESVSGRSRPHADLRTPAGRALIVDQVRAVGAEYVVNFAALNMVAESWEHYADYYRTNVIGVAELVESLRSCPTLRMFVQVSTPEVYGTTEVWMREGSDYYPSTPYAVSRAAIDMHLSAMHRTRGFPVCFTRTVNVYGPGQQLYRIIPKTVLSILRGKKLELHGGGYSTRSFIHINDVCDLIMRAAVRGAPGNYYHASTDEQTAIRDLVKRICSLMGVKFEDVVIDAPERPGKDMAYQLDCAQTRAEIGWQPRTALEDGLAETVAWYVDNRAQLEKLPLEYVHRP